MAFSTKSLVGFVTENDQNKQCRWPGWYLLCFADRRCLLAIWRFKEKHFIWVHVFSTKALIADTILRILLEMVTPFYVVILTTWRPSRLQEKGGTLISQWKTRVLDRPRESNPRPPALKSSAPPSGVNLPRLRSAVFYMFFRHVLNNKSTRCIILPLAIFLEFIRKYIILLTLNVKLTKPHTEVRRKKPPCFAYNVYPSAHPPRN